jgi:GT2 family glycosyltransferase
VSIILDNWNGKRYLDTCLRALSQLEYKSYEVVLVDDASTDGSVDLVHSSYPFVKVVQESQHHGFAGANNIGIRAARGEILLLLNVDTKPALDFLEPIVHTFDGDPSVGACQAKLLIMEHPRILDSAGSWFTWTGFLRHQLGEDERLYNTPQAVFSAKGAAMAMRRSVLDKVGLFDEDAYAYFEDTDLCWRIWLAGFKVVFVPESRVLHAVGGNSGQRVSGQIMFHSYKNRIRSILRNAGALTLLRIAPIHLIMCLSLVPFYALRGERDWASGVARAIVWNCLHIRQTLRLRAMTQRTRVWPDSDFLPQISRATSLTFFIRNYALGSAFKRFRNPVKQPKP